MKKLIAPPVTPERLYLQDKRRRNRDNEERQITRDLKRYREFRERERRQKLTNNRQRAIDIVNELNQLNQKRKELLAELRELSGGSAKVPSPWLDPIFSVIKNYPGISRTGISFQLLGIGAISDQELTNSLTTLRRRGWIENRGTRKNPKWYSRGKTPRSRWNTRESIPS